MKTVVYKKDEMNNLGHYISWEVLIKKGQTLLLLRQK